jgi:hypothetical protein
MSLMPLKHLLINPDIALNHLLATEILGCVAADKGAIQLVYGLHRSHGFFLAANQKAGLLMFDDLRDGAQRMSDNWRAAGYGLDRAQAKRFGEVYQI